MRVQLEDSTRATKKYVVTLPNGGKVHFGQAGAEDYTTHGDPKRMVSYLNRHGANGQQWDNPETAGFWSRWLLWSRPSLDKSIVLLKRKFGITVSRR